MQKRALPQTNLQVSVIGLGTDYFGTSVDRKQAVQIMDRYVESGGNLIDTAEIYAAWFPGGEHQSEKVIGDWLRERGLRDSLILSTKGAHPKLESMDVPRMSQREIESDLDSSLRRLGVDCIDIYWVHRDAPAVPAEEIVLALEALRKAGKIKHSGFSNWRLNRAEAARQAALRLGIPGFIASQNMWSLGQVNLENADPTWAYIDTDFVHWHGQHGFGAFPYLTQANGYFRRLEQSSLDQVATDARVRTLFDHPENRKRFQRIQVLQKKTSFSVNQLVLGYLLNQPFPVFPLIGPKNITDLDDSLKSGDVSLSSEDVAFLEGVRS
ncbi:MAG TPA: aldo/keto reductase [Chthoniobacterales bacterium]|nr:aldo/keto reductase [Chthoniobacterales bacterium]